MDEITRVDQRRQAKLDELTRQRRRHFWLWVIAIAILAIAAVAFWRLFALEG